MMNMSIFGPQSVQRTLMLGEFRLGALALHRQHQAAFFTQWQTPLGESVQWRDRSRDDHIESAAAELFGSGSDDFGVLEFELLDGLVQEGRTPEQRLDERDLKIRPNQGQDDTGQSGAGADIGDSGVLRNQPFDQGAVQ